MINRIRTSVAILAIAALTACGKSPNEPVYSVFTGNWGRADTSVLPPVTLEVRLEQSGYVGQVWLSGVTYTWPAVLTDSTMSLANPASSQLAPFSAVVVSRDELRATLRSPNQPDIVVQLYRRFRL